MTEQTPQPQTLRQRIEAIIQARHRDSETFMALQEALDETAEQPIKVYGVSHYEDWHEYPEWSKPDPDLLYARREKAQEYVDEAGRGRPQAVSSPTSILASQEASRPSGVQSERSDRCRAHRDH
jgi:hypothetical protein